MFVCVFTEVHVCMWAYHYVCCIFICALFTRSVLPIHLKKYSSLSYPQTIQNKQKRNPLTFSSLSSPTTRSLLFPFEAIFVKEVNIRCMSTSSPTPLWLVSESSSKMALAQHTNDFYVTRTNGHFSILIPCRV